jgi:hypothetical protein
MKTKWNVNPESSTTIARLISELEGCSYILDCIDEQDHQIIRNMISKYYKLYFKLKKKGDLNIFVL